MIRLISRRYARRPARTLVGALACLLALAGAAPATAENDLNKEMAALAGQIKLLLDQKGHDAIAVGDFRGPAKLAASGGPAICKALGEELKKIGVEVKRRADLEVNGDFRDVEDAKDGKEMLAVEIKAHVVDRRGAEVAALEPRGIFNLSIIASLVGVTVTLPADASEPKREQLLSDAMESPKVHLASTRISAEKDSPYAIELLVKEGGEYRARAASKDSDGFAFLRIKRDEIYAIRLINDSPIDAAVTLTIDGLNVFAFSEVKGYTHWIVPSKQALTVPGWYRSNKVSDSFLVTEYAKSAVAERLPNSATIGTITAGFAAAWSQGQSPPKDEGPTTRAGDATGKGPAVETDFSELVRAIGKLRSAVSVRYNKDDVPADLPAGKP